MLEQTPAAPGILLPTSLENCSPQTLTPPIPCAAGGRIYHTINLSCSNDNSSCCSDESPCTQFEVRVVGQGSTIFSACTLTADDDLGVIVISNSLLSQIDTRFTLGCSGWVAGGTSLHIDGNLSITVNGREVCNGITSLDVVVGTSPNIYASISGTLCGRVVVYYSDGGCGGPACGDICCTVGSICQSACGAPACAPAAYPVDCCNGRFCPDGTTCSADGESCEFKYQPQLMSIQAWEAP